MEDGGVSIKQGKTVKIPLDALRSHPRFAAIEKEISTLDKDKDGTIDATELAVFLEKQADLSSSLINLKFSIAALVIYLLLLLAANFGLAYAASELTKVVKVNDGTLTDTDGNALHTGAKLDTADYSTNEFVALSNSEFLNINKLMFLNLSDSTNLRFDVNDVYIADGNITFAVTSDLSISIIDGISPFEATKVKVFSKTQV
mmetsp:Transcript_24204/g.38316  ORF Transcript_24204/g.38316 Transcript_24204/m.38316 type:complete len:202 (-) Transcript_24204:59-664(-)